MNKIQKQAALNREIKEFIENKTTSYSLDDIKYIRRYTGAGGLGGSDNSGLLYEFYTPYPIIEKMVGLANKYSKTPIRKVLEPSCGIGRFLEYFDPENTEITAYEYNKDNPTGYRIAKVSFPNATISDQSFESMFYIDEENENNGKIRTKRVRVYPDPSYDLVIGNPPYGAWQGTSWDATGERRVFKGVKNYYEYFIIASLSVINPLGLLVFIIPQSFADNQRAEVFGALKQDGYRIIGDDKRIGARMIDTYRMPRGAFDFTQESTDIVVLQKIEM